MGELFGFSDIISLCVVLVILVVFGVLLVLLKRQERQERQESFDGCLVPENTSN